jgi:protein-L-isoaspartate(D-aspartate) O-methyltransferase
MVRGQLAARRITDEAVLDAMRRVPRERFVPPDLERHAYDDNALPIGNGQTISQPYIVARMSQAIALGEWQAAHPDRRLKVLDVGTGSGYQAAVLAEMGADVVSIERDAALADAARERLTLLGYNVRVVLGDGSAGLPAEAPFAGIVVAAAAPDVPHPLVEQLDDDARLVVPVGDRWEQRMVVVRRRNGEAAIETIEPAVFVPLVGEHGFSDR